MFRNHPRHLILSNPNLFRISYYVLYSALSSRIYPYNYIIVTCFFRGLTIAQNTQSLIFTTLCKLINYLNFI